MSEVEITAEATKAIAMAIAAGIGVFGPGIGIGMLVAKALEAMGRTMFIGIAFVEALAIFALVVAFVIKFA